MCDDCKQIQKEIDALRESLRYIIGAIDEIGDTVALFHPSMDGHNWGYSLIEARGHLESST
jgi:hypothetical protein